MEEKFIAAWMAARKNAAAAGVKLRPVAEDTALQTAHRCLRGSRESDGFAALVQLDKTQWTLEALAVDPRFTSLFTDEEANIALQRLLEAGYRFA